MEVTNEEIANETWREIFGFPKYEVSNLGRVKSRKFSREKILKPTMKRKWKRYLYVNLVNAEGLLKTKKVHRLVAHAFLGDEPTGCEVDHGDTNPENNRATNLAYLTHQQNIDRSRCGAGKRRPWCSKSGGFKNAGWFAGKKSQASVA